MQEHVNDPYVQAARRDGYRSRAAYKLLELQTSLRSRTGVMVPLLREGMSVLDLGAAPGGWSQVAARLTASSRAVGGGLVIAVDRLPMDPVPDVVTLQGDFLEESTWTAIREQLAAHGRTGIDRLLSDMAPNMSGVRSVDQLRGAALAEAALECALELLHDGGGMVLKLFHGTEFQTVLRQVQALFQQVRVVKPSASRDRSPEQYLVASGYRRGAAATARTDGQDGCQDG
jgi:23S rRNA (uridine2552-2'-O)-methyltransferase